MQALEQLLAGAVGACEEAVGGAVDRLVERESRLMRAEVERTAWSVGWILVACVLATLGGACVMIAVYVAVAEVAPPIVGILTAAATAFVTAGVAAWIARRQRGGIGRTTLLPRPNA